MSKTVKRILIAALISASGFATTHAVYKLSENKGKGLKNSKPIARLVSTLNEVQRKSVQKIIWEPATDNEILYVGEAIRTSSNAEARIVFLDIKTGLDSSTAIDLEPDSAIVLEESDGKLSLDFLKGNILVKSDSSGGQGDAGITLKSGNKNIALGKSEFTLGKNKTGALDLQVLKGNVAGLDGAESGGIKILSPMPNEPIYVNTAANEQAQIKWQPLPAGYQVYLETGLTRNDLQAVSGAMAAGEKGTMNAPIKLGKMFFRLVARSQTASQPELSSSVIRSSVLAKLPPVPLSPENESLVSVNVADPDLTFLWGNPAGFSDVILEIANSPNLKLNYKKIDLKNVTTYSFKPEKSGQYYWRVSGQLSGRAEVVSSTIRSFKLNVLNEIQPPELEFPKENDKFPVDTLKERGLIMSWKASPGAERYRLVIEKVNLTASGRGPASKEKVFEDEAKTLQTSVKNLKTGTYTWTVTSIGAKNAPSKPSESRTFSIQSLPLLRWADGKTEETYYYITLKPSVALKWEKGDPKATKWVAKIYKDGGEEKAITQKLTATNTEINLPQEGLYNAEVEAFDDRNNLLARSPRREVKVTSAPLLPAPEFADNTPKEIEATGSGAANIQWQDVQGANQYVMQIKSSDGKTAKVYNFKTQSGALNGLMPGEYRVTLSSVDEHGRQGPNGEERTLKVPAQSAVRAPKLKGVKVK